MRILVCTRHAEMLGGVETYLRRVIPLLRQRGHEIRIAVELPSRRPEDDWTRGLGISATLLQSADVAEAEIAAFGPDVVFNHQVANLEVEQALVATGCASLFLHSYHGLCISGRRMHMFPRPTPCARKFGPACLALYLPRRCGGLDPLHAVGLYALQSNRLRCMGSYRRIVVPSESLRRLLLEAGLEDSRIAVVPHFIEMEPLHSGEHSALGEPIVALFLGRLTDEKGCLLLPKALQIAIRLSGRAIRLIVAGDGPLRSVLQRQLEANHINFAIHGWVNEEERAEILTHSDLLIFPSVWLEPFGLAGIEAASYGVPAVGFPYGGVEDWLVPGVTGELAEAGTPSAEGLGRAIARAIATPEHLRELSRGARQQLTRFGVERHISRIEAALTP